MTQEEQQQVFAARNAHYERQVGNLATSGADMAALAEKLHIELKAAKARIAELEKSQPQDNVVPIKEPVA